jgi:hypothetical protein
MPAPPGSDPPAPVRSLAGELLLAAWEAGTRAPELRRPLTLLAAAQPDTSQADLVALPVAARDLGLLRLRELTFGSELAVFGSCPVCGERLEFTLDAGQLAGQLETAAAAGPVEWTEDGRDYRLRPVTTGDLLATLAAPDPDAAQEMLLARCLDQAPPYPPGILKRFEELHADAEVRCAIDCPACTARHVYDLDIARFLWREVSVAARRLLAEVHVLAAAYGWAERDILALSPHRRAAYLELAGT